MIIKGVVEVDGVRLVVNVEAPDDEREIFVTNIHPAFLVVHKERWPIEYLDLPPETYTELKAGGIKTLGDITDGDWEVHLSKALNHRLNEVVRAVREVRSLAVVFDQAPSPNKPERPEALPIESPAPVAPPAVSRTPVSLDTQPTRLGIPEAVLVKLRKAGREVGTIRELISIGRRKIIMTTGILAADVQAIEAGLKSAGLDWNTSYDPTSK